MLKQLVTWWGQQWLALLPRPLTAFGPWSRAYLIDWPGDASGTDPLSLTLTRRSAGRETVIGRFASDERGLAELRRACAAQGRGGRDLLLRLTPDALLEHRFAMPLAAEAHATEVMRHEIDRLTPFGAEDVFWTCAVLRRDRARGRVFLRLSCVMRAPLQAFLLRLAAAGLSPRAIEVAAADGGLRHMMIDAAAAGRGRDLPQHALRFAAALCVILAVTATVSPFILQQQRIARVESEIALLRPRVAEARAIHARIAAALAGADMTAAAQAAIGDPLAAMAAVTAVLPDNTFLTSLTLSQKTIVMTGQSIDPASLIAAMSADPAMRNPSFAAPVTMTSNGQASLFSITADLAR
jgi:general secretion pathway protein L